MKKNLKLFLIFFLLLLTFTFTSCSKKSFFNTKELNNFGLSFLQAPKNSSNFYKKSNNKQIICYMNVTTDDDVRSYVLAILKEFETNSYYNEYGYAKSDDMYQSNRNIYTSNNIDDYLISKNTYSENSVSFNSYQIFYTLSDSNKKSKMFILTITSYTEEDTIYLKGYNLNISVVKMPRSKYTVIKDK